MAVTHSDMWSSSTGTTTITTTAGTIAGGSTMWVHKPTPGVYITRPLPPAPDSTIEPARDMVMEEIEYRRSVDKLFMEPEDTRDYCEQLEAMIDEYNEGRVVCG